MVCFGIVFEGIRGGAVWERSEGLDLGGTMSLGSLELASACSGADVSTLNPFDFFALANGVPLGEGRAFVTVADELSDDAVVALELSVKLLLAPARWK